MNLKNAAAERLRRLDALRQAEHSLKMEMDCLDGEQTALERSLRRVQCQVSEVEGALQVLNPEERLVADMLFVYPQRGNVQRLCGILQVEQSSVYRRRDRVLKKMALALFGK